MKKRLLFALMAMCVAVSGFALSEGEYVYTPQGRFLITGNNVASSDFSNLNGWTVVSATENQKLEDVFSIAQEEGTGMWYAKSLVATAGEGMYFKFEPTSSAEVYVVSFKIKGTKTSSIRVKTDILATDLVKVEGNTDGAFGGATDVLLCNKAESLSDEWQTFNYAIVGDGKTRTYFISFTGMAENIEIADLQIAVASQVADLRQRDAMLEKLKAYVNCYEWSEDVLDESGILENIENLEDMGDETLQAALDKELKAAQKTLDSFLEEYMDDFFAAKPANKLGWGGKLQNQTTFGDWTVMPSGRGFRGGNNVSNYPDLGHYAGSNKWGTAVFGVTMEKDLDPGSYVFSIEGNAAFRENSSSKTWTNNDGLKVGIATAYITKVLEEGATPVASDTLAYVVKLLDPVDYTTSIIAAKVPEAGKYEIGYKVVCREELQNTTAGGVVYVANASLYLKNDNKYSQKQLAYEADVLEQIKVGRDNLTTAAENMANEDNLWGKAELQACIDTVAPKITQYEAMTEDDIMATYEEDYKKSTTEETGYHVYKIYQEAVKDIIAANRRFVAVNDTLNSIQKVIDIAEATLVERIYDTATGKADLQAAIDKAKGVQAEMKAAQYSEENAATIVAANKELNEAIETFKTTIPADKITEIIALDFEKGATLNEETQAYEIAGTNTVMTIQNFSTTTPTAESANAPFELGIDVNGAKELPNVLRVGNGVATATIPAQDYGTNIVKASMDFWFGRVNNGYSGFNLLDENNERVAGFVVCPFNNAITGSKSSLGYDDFSLAIIGDFIVGSTAGDVAACADDNKTHIECIFDFGEKTMYMVSTTPNGIHTSDKVVFNGNIPTVFNVVGDYSTNTARYRGRRSWFDNLKIEKISAGTPTGIENVKAAKANDAVIYNLAGQKVNKSFKGIAIMNGKKIVVK